MPDQEPYCTGEETDVNMPDDIDDTLNSAPQVMPTSESLESIGAVYRTAGPHAQRIAKSRKRSASGANVHRIVAWLDGCLLELRETKSRNSSRRAKMIAGALGRVLEAHDLCLRPQRQGLRITIETLLQLETKFRSAGVRACEPEPLRRINESNGASTHEALMSRDRDADDVELPINLLAQQWPHRLKLRAAHKFCGDLQAIDGAVLTRLQSLLAIDQFPRFSVNDIANHSTSIRSISCASITSIQACLEFLIKMDGVQDVAMIRTNCAYWVLGSAFSKYAMEADGEAQSIRSRATHPRTQVHEVLQRLEREHPIRAMLAGTDGATDPVRRKAFVQRLQRARKYVRLTKIFPESLLLAVPQVCVTRMDKMTHQVLDIFEAAQDPTSLDLKRSITQTLEPLRASVRAGLDSMAAVLLK